MNKIVLKRVNGWWIADDSNKVFKAICPVNAKAREAWDKAKGLFPNFTIGLDSYSIGPATVSAYGPVVWLNN